MFSRKCVFVSLFTAVILVAAGVGTYLAVSRGQSESDENYANSTTIQSETNNNPESSENTITSEYPETSKQAETSENSVTSKNPETSENPITSNNSETSENPTTSENIESCKNPESYEPLVFDPSLPLFTSTNDGRILQLDPYSGNHATLLKEETYLIKSFEYYRKKQILFYSTEKPNKPIKTLNNGYSMNFSARWTKTAMAVNFLTEQLFVLDGLAEKIYAIDTSNCRYTIYLTDLDKPKDILVDSKKQLMFIMQESSILWVDMEARRIVDKVKFDNVAFAVDRQKHEIYFAGNEYLNSMNYVRSTSSIYGKRYVLSMTVLDSCLLYISKLENNINKSLITCCNGCTAADVKKSAVYDEQVSFLSHIKAYELE